MKTVQRMVVGAFLGLAMYVVAACGGGSGDDGGSGSESCGKPGRTGVTDCPYSDCSAGTYCKEQDLADYTCLAGCTSDENCSETEKCVKCNGDAIGTCQACSKSEEDVCKPVVLTCQRDTTLDLSCPTEGAKAYACPPNLEPPADLGSCSNEGGGLWCCGGMAPSNPCMRDNTFDAQFCMGLPGTPYFYSCEPDMTAPVSCSPVVPFPGGYCCP